VTDPADVPARPESAGARSPGRRLVNRAGSRPGRPVGPPVDTEAVPVTVLVDHGVDRVTEPSRAGESNRPGRPAPEVGIGDLLGPPAVAPTEAVAPGWVPGSRPTRAQVRAARRLQARKVGRLVRHVDLWSLLKIALLFNTCLLVVGVVAGIVMWWVLQRSGVLTSVEGFVEQIFLLEEFRFDGRTVFRFGVFGGLLSVVAVSLLTVLGGLLFNLISDLTGGIRVSVVELETARPAPPRRRRPPRQG